MTPSEHWSAERARAWAADQPWLVGVNHITSSAANQLQMWQPDTFDPDRIETELGWAAALGLNSTRVYLHDLPWAADPAGFTARIEHYLAAAHRHGIRVLLVLFDSVWDPDPRPGPQPDPVPGVHNSRWVQSPGRAALTDPGQLPRLRDYLTGVVAAFAEDDRILGWDVWNEPDNTNPETGYFEPEKKLSLVADLLPQAFDWVRAAGPTQPLTSGVWAGSWRRHDALDAIPRVQLELSDVISFHHYGSVRGLRTRARWLRRYQRPILCTEFLARTAGSRLVEQLRAGHDLELGMYAWGLARGRTQTHLPWNSWGLPYVSEPSVWFHDLLDQDGSPYDPAEITALRDLTGRGSDSPN